jgi:hypothetical protein
MSFESVIIAFSDRFLSERTFQLVVAPALADLQFDEDTGRRRRAANRLAVIRAVAGGFGDDVSRDSGSLLKMALLSVCYHLTPLAMGLDYFKTWSDFFTMAAVVLALSLAPVMVCYWPPRRAARPVD